MAKKLYEESDIQDIAVAIREKNGETTKYKTRDMAAAVRAIPTSGGDDAISAIIDGTITEIYNDAATYVRSRAFQDCTMLTKADIPNATKIGDYVFQGCSNLTSVNIQNATVIGRQNFSGCSKITDLSFPNVESMGDYQFYNCYALTSINLPKIQVVHSDTFGGCTALKFIDLPSVKELRAAAFGHCIVLNKIVLRYATDVVTLASVNVFINTPFAAGGTGGAVFVPFALIEQYKTATNWSALYEAGTCTFEAIEGSEYE